MRSLDRDAWSDILTAETFQVSREGCLGNAGGRTLRSIDRDAWSDTLIAEPKRQASCVPSRATLQADGPFLSYRLLDDGTKNPVRARTFPSKP